MWTESIPPECRRDGARETNHHDQEPQRAARPFIVEDKKFLHLVNRLMWPSRYRKDEDGKLWHRGYTAWKNPEV